MGHASFNEICVTVNNGTNPSAAALLDFYPLTS